MRTFSLRALMARQVPIWIALVAAAAVGAAVLAAYALASSEEAALPAAGSASAPEAQPAVPAPSREEDEEAIIRAAKSFAAADDAEACELLTDGALERLYGGREGCERRAEQFRPGKIIVTDIKYQPQLAAVTAASVRGSRLYKIEMRKVLPDQCTGADPVAAGVWKVSEVSRRS